MAVHSQPFGAEVLLFGSRSRSRNRTRPGAGAISTVLSGVGANKCSYKGSPKDMH